MKRAIRCFCVILAVLIGIVFDNVSSWALWPAILVDTASCSSFDRNLKRARRSIVTCCFFNPDAPETSPGVADRMAYPVLGARLEYVPVAVCLWGDRARGVFDDYFLSEGSQSIIDALTDMDKISPYENVFIISFADLRDFLIKTNDVTCYVANSPDGVITPSDRDWNWKRVILRSRLVELWQGPPRSCIAPTYEHCVKVRILMDGLIAGKCGEAIRVFKGDSAVEKFIWAPYWDGEGLVERPRFLPLGE